ncbi:MAG: PepSY-like domain-containing protein [Muribaculaceae bacterium]|nr:PepSY-like domain-containing protein [Muribaculaceae bacterium]
MKTFKILAVLVAMFATNFAMKADNDRVITYQNLPATAQAFLKQHFPEKTPSFITADWDDFTVRYQTGEKVEFDTQGNWKDVECYGAAVPAALVPQAIDAAVKAQFPGMIIMKIERKYGGYEVKLSNGLEVKFNNAGQVMEIDD